MYNIKYVPLTATVELKKLPSMKIFKRFSKLDLKTKEIVEYLNWEKSKNELVIYCRARFDIEIPKKYNYLIDLNNPLEGIVIHSEIKHALWNGVIPLNMMEEFYHTFLIIKFKNSIPNCLNSLVGIDKSDLKIRFALCDEKDKNIVINKIKNND